MLEFHQNGKKVTINPIYGNGQVGQTVILGKRVDWGVNPSPTMYPLSQYSCPSVFTIMEKIDGAAEIYILRDSQGNCFRALSNANGRYLYDAQEWLTWNDMRENEKKSRKQRKIEQLEGHVEMLKDILIKQGIRIVTEAQAKELGI